MPKVYATASPTYIAPWLGWMDMKGHPGHTVWTGPARKVDNVEEYPRELLDFMVKNYPHKPACSLASWAIRHYAVTASRNFGE